MLGKQTPRGQTQSAFLRALLRYSCYSTLTVFCSCAAHQASLRYSSCRYCSNAQTNQKFPHITADLIVLSIREEKTCTLKPLLNNRLLNEFKCHGYYWQQSNRAEWRHPSLQGLPSGVNSNNSNRSPSHTGTHPPSSPLSTRMPPPMPHQSGTMRFKVGFQLAVLYIFQMYVP